MGMDRWITVRERNRFDDPIYYGPRPELWFDVESRWSRLWNFLTNFISFK